MQKTLSKNTIISLTDYADLHRSFHFVKVLEKFVKIFFNKKSAHRNERIMVSEKPS